MITTLSHASASAMVLAAVLGVGPAPAAPATTPTVAAPAKPQPKPDQARAVLFLDWSDVFGGKMLPMIDPNRLSANGQESLAKLEGSWNVKFKRTGHGMEPYQTPRGVRISVEKARKSQPWLVPDQPWERSICGATVLQEDEIFRCWYYVRLASQSVEYAYQNGRAIELSGSALCYAESKDGFDWVKPKLGLISFNGSKDNNLVSQLNFMATVFRDDHAPPEERYKSFELAELPAEELARADNPMNKYGLYGLVSPDGLHWKRLRPPLIRHFCDTTNIGAWDKLLKKYVGYFRDHEGGRAISRSETSDFQSWPPPVTLFCPGPEDGPSEDYYTSCYTTYPGNPALRLLFPAIYHQVRDCVDIRLALSNNGRCYNWVSHESIIDLGKAGQWDGGSIYASPDLVRLPDGRLALHFSAYPNLHNEAYFAGFYKDYNQTAKLAWALWDDGRLAGIEADGEGEFYTHPLNPDGQIEINARTARGGSIALEILQAGKPVQGFSLAESIPFQGDSLWVAPKWKGQSDISKLHGQKIQFHFRLTRAKLFGYRIAKTPQPDSAAAATPSASNGGFKQIVAHGMILGRPSSQPEGTRNIVSYELGQCFQLDRTHCLLVASMDEQGGPDLCVGNDAFVFEKLSDLKAEKAIPINRAEPNFKLPGKEQPVFLAKYPMTGFFVPLGAFLESGQPHPAAGSGVLMSLCVAFHHDRSDTTAAGAGGDAKVEDRDAFTEVVQVRWDGKTLTKTSVRQERQFLDQTVVDKPFSRLCPLDKGLVGPFAFRQAAAGSTPSYRAMRFDWDGNAWTASGIGKPFTTVAGECEPTIQRQGERYLITTRGRDPKGRMYISRDGLDYTFQFDWTNAYAPRSLNLGLDGSLYLATNPNQGWFRNPLMAYPMVGDSFGPGVVIHDQDGVRDDHGDKLPFVDHGLGANLLLEGRWRHLLFFRVCDLKERTLYGSQQWVVKKVHGDTGPIPKRATSGVYAVEMEYDKVICPAFVFAETGK